MSYDLLRGLTCGLFNSLFGFLETMKEKKTRLRNSHLGNCMLSRYCYCLKWKFNRRKQKLVLSMAEWAFGSVGYK